MFEVTPSGETVWEYQSPVSNSQILADGENAADFQTRIFRALRYGPDYPAFEGRDLTGTGVIELNPVADGCELLGTERFEVSTLIAYPNPSSEFITTNLTENVVYEIYDLSGKKVLRSSQHTIDVRHLMNGIYILKARSSKRSGFTKFIKRS